MNKTRIYLFIVSIFLLNTFSQAQWISIDNKTSVFTNPAVTLLSDDASGTVIKIDIPGYLLQQFNANGKTYSSISIDDDEGITSEKGLPEIPHIAKVLAIPDRGIVSVEVLELGEKHIYKNVDIAPSRESWKEGDPETDYIENSKFYSSGELYPEVLASVEEPSVFRDFRIARVSVFPIRYSPAKKEIESYSSITVRVKYSAGLGVNEKTTPKRKIAPTFDKVYRSFIFNYDEVLNARYGGRLEGHNIMMCIMPDIFVNTFQTYADWKQKTGTEIVITKFSDIGATGNTPEVVKNYILNVYTTWVDAPTHILLVGDAGSPQNIAPYQTWHSPYDGYTFPNEDYFVELEGNDFFPEMMIGRFTNQEDYRLQVIISKLLRYESEPERVDNAWYKKGIVCSNDAYQSQADVKRFTAQLMRENGGFTSVDTMMSKNPCLYDLDDVIAAINQGRGFLNYRGEGWYSGWWASCTPFQTENVNSLNNGRKLTFVTSIGCGVAGFHSSNNSFGEAWLEQGTPTAPRGGVTFIGPTSNTHTTYNNKIDKGIYTGMFVEGMDSPGEALLRGKLYMFNVYGNNVAVEHHYKIYCILGDPSLHVWKDIPKPVTVSKPDSVFIGFNQVQISVVDSVSGLPVDSARICISGNGVYVIGLTDINGVALLDVTPATIDTLNVTVCGGNVIPVVSTIIVTIGSENITPNGAPVLTDLNGNQDGLINPNETGVLNYTLKNFGTIISNNVQATLTIPDTITTVQILTSDPVLFGNIQPSDSSAGSPFQFFVQPDCPIGTTIPFHLHVESMTSTWDYFYNVKVHGCKLDFTELLIDDEGNILRNFRIDPGETVKLKLNISNTGDDIAPDVIAKISTSDQYITITDSTGTFGTILKDSTVVNESDYFVISASEQCPVQYNAELFVTIETQNGFYPYTVERSFMLPVAMPSAFDVTGPDAYGYYAYSSSDALWTQAPQYNWFEIDGTGTQIPKPSGVNDFTQTVTLPFTFRYYGNDYTQVRISSDGWIAFGSGTQTAFANTVLPNNDAINNMVAGFWDDLFRNETIATAKLLYYYDAANNRFIAEWSKVPHFNAEDELETFQIILLDPAYYPTPTGDGEIIVQYKDVEEPSSITVGIENNTQDVGLLYLFDETYDVTANELVSEFAIKFTTRTPVVTDVKDEEDIASVIPDDYSLEQNYPNPFNPETKIRYAIPEPGFVTVKIYRVDGELVKTLSENYKSAGRYEITWDGTNNFSQKVSSGVYFYRLQANDFSQVKKMILLK
ncbi:MAG: T9SS type A sorting domain-containing protein [Ignavibacteriales bacterium]|nr:MAG: T9SS type A sorting domain-containing protein [Ignavibacteriales bacterium]